MADVLQAPRSFEVSLPNCVLGNENVSNGGQFNNGINSLNCFNEETNSVYSSDDSSESSFPSANTDVLSLGTNSETASNHSFNDLNEKQISPSTPEPYPSDVYALDLPLSKLVGKEVYDIAEHGTVASFIQHRVESGLENASFLVTNLVPIVNQFNQWKQELPMVEPFYAVKCNPDPVIVRLLASMGCSFDCATMGEIDLVLNGLGDESFKLKGKASSSIVYANPAKMEHMLRFAIDNKVKMTVFDGEDELKKIAAIPGGHQMELLLRLTTDDKSSICRFSKKFGCPVAEAPRLLELAKSLGLRVAGVSFHVGSGCGDAAAYVTALEHARSVFETAARMGMRPMTIVDVGGGFPGDKSGYGGGGMPSFQALAAAIRQGIQLFDGLGVRFIAEPGRYFVSASTVIATKIYGRKGGDNAYQALYVDDGVYGSFNNVVYDHATPVPHRLALSPAAEGDIPSAVFGPTCDGLDQMCTLEGTVLPRCHVGDWLYWPDNGAYTHTASFVFNGYTHVPTKTYCVL